MILSIQGLTVFKVGHVLIIILCCLSYYGNPNLLLPLGLIAITIIHALINSKVKDN